MAPAEALIIGKGTIGNGASAASPAVESGEAVDNAIQVLTEVLASLGRQVQEARDVVRDVADRFDRRAESSGDRPRVVLPFPPRHPTDDAAPDLPSLRLRCLGSFEAYLGDEAILQRRGGKGRAILQYLATRPRQPVPRDTLLEALWPETDPAVANNRLKVAMHHLRQVCVALEERAGCDECVIYRDGCYRFNPDLPLWTDVDAFTRAWREGSRSERAGQVEAAMAAYAQAEALYRGDYFEEEPFAEWALLRREELKETYLTILGKLSRHRARAGDLDGAIAGWMAILARDPWREDVYRDLMIGFARRGQRALALHWFQVCARVLQAQLQLEPEPETVALHERIRRGDDLALRSRA